MSSSSPTRKKFFWGIIAILLGFLFLFNNFDFFDIGDFFATFWPLILVVIGVKIILHSRRSHREEQDYETTTFSSDSLSESRFIGDIHMKLDHQNFRGGTVSNFIGNITLDISNIALHEGEQHLSLSGFIGDITLLPPKNAAFSIHASITIGDLVMFGQKDDGFGVSRNYKSDGFDETTTKLKITLSYFIGDIKVL